MFKVIETAGQDEPWWFFDDWEKMDCFRLNFLL